MVDAVVVTGAVAVAVAVAVLIGGTILAVAVAVAVAVFTDSKQIIETVLKAPARSRSLSKIFVALRTARDE